MAGMITPGGAARMDATLKFVGDNLFTQGGLDRQKATGAALGEAADIAGPVFFGNKPKVLEAVQAAANQPAPPPAAAPAAAVATGAPNPAFDPTKHPNYARPTFSADGPQIVQVTQPDAEKVLQDRLMAQFTTNIDPTDPYAGEKQHSQNLQAQTLMAAIGSRKLDQQAKDAVTADVAQKPIIAEAGNLSRERIATAGNVTQENVAGLQSATTLEAQRLRDPAAALLYGGDVAGAGTAQSVLHPRDQKVVSDGLGGFFVDGVHKSAAELADEAKIRMAEAKVKKRGAPAPTATIGTRG